MRGVRMFKDLGPTVMTARAKEVLFGDAQYARR